MGRIVKYCSSCDEGFAEKFGYCPNCGATLQAFEMNPLEAGSPTPITEGQPPVPEMIASDIPAEEPIEIEAAPIVVEEIDEPIIEEPVVEEPVIAKAAAVTTPIFTQTKAVDVDRIPTSLSDAHSRAESDGDYFVTVIEEKNGKQRNALLLGVLGLSIVFWSGMVVYSIFAKDLDVGSINDDIFNAVIVDDVPTQTEQEIQQKKDKDAGGGGGGGRDEKEEVTQGDLADQSKNPTRPPDAKVFRSDNFELKTPPPQTEGTKTFEKKFDRWGDPNGRFASFSNGTGTGGGQGSGVGTGQGSGRGTGAGSGTGSGYGGGLGNGNGNGTGDGDGGSAPPPRAAGVSAGLKILSKPRPGYTDAARQNNIQGTVILRVTFLASGQVGSISPVKGLGNGLTEQAIAAARRINFEPMKVNGIPQSVTKQIEYTFSIY